MATFPRGNDGGLHALAADVDDRDSADAALVLAALQRLEDQEIARSNALAGRGRNAFALAAGFFAISQTVVFSDYLARNINPVEQHRIIYLAIASGVALAIAGFALIISDRPRKSRHLDADQILEEHEHATDEYPLVRRLAELYAVIVDERRATTAKHAKAFRIARWFAALAVAMVLVELAYALTVRL
jgi:hypothetical protein